MPEKQRWRGSLSQTFPTWCFADGLDYNCHNCQAVMGIMGTVVLSLALILGPQPSIITWFLGFCAHFPPQSAHCRLCPQDWFLHGNKCYWVSKGKETWRKSKEDCEGKLSQMLVIQNQEEVVRNLCIPWKLLVQD
uniref:C-type lectin domain-containing protein n=1 Tax=Varanus komodoensis TaxID=61221 RepID=A0A8D2L7Q0_VARKO